MGEGIAELRNLVAITKEVITFITRERPCYETMQRGLVETIEEKVHLQILLTIREEGGRSLIVDQGLIPVREPMRLGV